MRTYFVYILANHSRHLYIGVTNDLRRRMAEHRQPDQRGYAASFGITQLVYYEVTADARAAITREKQLKRWPRARKIKLVDRGNGGWLVLAAYW